MSDYIVPINELQAVNELLASVREAPITSLSDAAEQAADASIALDRLRSAARSIQSKGWTFNTDLEYPLLPDSTGVIYLPANAITADFCDANFEDKGRFVFRGQRVYDRHKHTFVIARKLFADLVILLPFDDMPHTARDLATKMATRQFQQFVQGEAGDFRFTTEDINDAWAALYASETDAGDHNMLEGGDVNLHRAAFRTPSGRR